MLELTPAQKAWNTRRRKKRSGKIKACGVEIEGAWYREIEAEIYEDFSVRDLDRSETSEIFYCGEIATSSMGVSFKKCIEFIEANHQDNSNSSCGTHYHFSVYDRNDYIKLMSKEFWDLFLVEVEKWGHENEINEGSPFWSRLNGNNRFTRKVFQPERQVYLRSKNEERYTHLNYCYTLHGTFECRLFPTFHKWELNVKAFQFLYNLIESYLRKCKDLEKIKIERNIESEIIDEGMSIICV